MTSEKLTITLSIDGDMIEAEGYVYDTCPGSIKSAISRTNKAYIEALDEAKGNGTLMQIAWREFLRYAMLALIPDLKPAYADTISGNEEKSLQILRFLGAVPPADEAAERDGEADAAPPLITESSTPTSSEPSALTTT
jgi:hypothetical protein